MTWGDFHHGSEKGTARVHQILCQSWEKCYRDPHNDSTSLRGPKLESCAGVSMACPVQERSHISWWWRTHRETHKLHNSWNCCMDSRAHLSRSMLDHSRYCWGGNLLWDMPMGSDRRIGHACRSQICAQDPNQWPEAAVCQRLHWTELNWTEKQNGCHPTPTILPIWHPVTSSYFQKWNWSWKDAGLIPLRRYRLNRRQCLTLW